MQFSYEFAQGVQITVGWGLFLLFVLIAIWQAPWRALINVTYRQHALMVALVVLCLLGSFRFEVMPGLHFHPFLITTVTLVFGWSFCLLVGALTMVILAAVGSGIWQTLPLDWLFTVLIPASITLALLNALRWVPTRNLFVYLLGLGFFGTLFTTLVNCCLLLLFFYSVYPTGMAEKLWQHFEFVVPLLYSEGFINGMLVTSITVFKPDLVKTFDDERFLKSD